MALTIHFSVNSAFCGAIDNVDNMSLKDTTNMLRTYFSNNNMTITNLPNTATNDTMLIDICVDNTCDLQLETPHNIHAMLQNASMNNNVIAMKIYIANGADVNARFASGWTALISASTFGSIDAIAELIKCGADINAKDNDGWTALMYASFYNHTNAAILIASQHGCNK